MTPISPDLIVLTALTEEAQVVIAVLDSVAEHVETTKVGMTAVHSYTYGAAPARIAVASAHDLGAVSMGIFATALLEKLAPQAAVLVGIAAAVGDDLAVGDVAVASEVVKGDDVSVQANTLQFRTAGYPSDRQLLSAFGELRTLGSSYGAWQSSCISTISAILEKLNQLRRVPMISPSQVPRPHLVVGKTAGTPFLLRDSGFRDALRHGSDGSSSIAVSAPLHPKLVSAEMESHGFMEAARGHGVPGIVVKAISDAGDAEKGKLEEKTGGFYRAFACANALLAVLHALADVTRATVPDESTTMEKGDEEVGDSDLLLLGDVFVNVEEVSIASNGEWTIRAPEQSSEVESALKALSGVTRTKGTFHHRRTTRATYGDDSRAVEIAHANRDRRNSVAEWNFVLREIKPQHAGGGVMEPTYSTHTKKYSPTDVAELRARRILLAEEFTNSDRSAMMVAHAVAQCTPPQVELARVEGTMALERLRLLMVRELHEAHVMDDILELELFPDSEGVRVAFRGRRDSPYTNGTPDFIEVEGILRTTIVS